MSQPDYPVFSKKHQRANRNFRGAYNFEQTKDYKLAEKWFQERRDTIKNQSTPSSTISSTQPTHRPPPGFQEKQVKLCKKCFIPQKNPFIARCCNNSFCGNCLTNQMEIYNRCFTCNTVINLDKFEEYEGLDLKIPSYEEFDYIDPDLLSTINNWVNIYKEFQMKY
jgi:hypothetical protein